MSSPETLVAEPGVGGAEREERSGRRFWAVLLLIVLAALGLRVAYVVTAQVGEPLLGDAIYYAGQADAIGDGRGFACPYPGTPSCPTPVPVADHPPMTALVMSIPRALGETRLGAKRLLMSAVGAAVVLVIGLVGREVASDRAGWIAAVLAAVYANLWVNDALVMAETLAALAVALAVLISYRFARGPSFGKAVALGAVCGFGILTRAELGLLLPIVALPVVLITPGLARGRRLAFGGVMVCTSIIVIAPWVIPNLFRFQQPVLLSTNDGITLSGANCPSVYSGPGLGLWTLDCQGAPPGDQSETSAFLRHRGLKYIREHLGRLPVVVVAREGLAWSIFRPETMVSYNKSEGRPAWVSWLGFVQYWLLFPVAVAGAIVLWRRRVMLTPLLGQFVLVVLTAALFYGLVRFRVPAEVSIVVLAAVAVDSLVGRTWPRRREPGPLVASEPSSDPVR